LRSRSNRVCGVDEAGRGPIAGPVVAAAVLLPERFYHPLCRDSKTLSEKKREEAYRLIKEVAVAIGVGIVGPKVIDRINIRNATFRAMMLATRRLKVKPNLFLVDGFDIPSFPFPQVGIVNGDACEIAISAASIIAKVTRDRIMLKLHRRYPDYGFNTNKGYPTRYHLKRLKELGPTPIHRFSFRPVRDVTKR